MMPVREEFARRTRAGEKSLTRNLLPLSSSPIIAAKDYAILEAGFVIAAGFRVYWDSS
jgi:hypothetical protein